MNDTVIRQVEQFVYREARLLDERRFRDWLKLFTEDIRYWMGQRTARYPKISKAIILADEDRYDDNDLPREGGLAPLLQLRANGTVLPIDGGMPQ